MLKNIYQISLPGALHVAELAKNTHVTPATIRYYSRFGLLHPNRDPNNGYRYFSLADVRRVKFIRQAQELGLKIADIKIILETAEQGKTSCGAVETLVRNRLEAITQQIEDLLVTKARINSAIQVWETSGNLELKGANFCPLIEMLPADRQAIS